MSSLNFCYFVGYLLFAAYILPSYGMEDKNNYLFSSLGAASSALGVCVLYHSVKL